MVLMHTAYSSMGRSFAACSRVEREGAPPELSQG
jgi:hypothetical protein